MQFWPHQARVFGRRGYIVGHETVRQWPLKFGQGFANLIRRHLHNPHYVRHNSQ